MKKNLLLSLLTLALILSTVLSISASASQKSSSTQLDDRIHVKKLEEIAASTDQDNQAQAVNQYLSTLHQKELLETVLEISQTVNDEEFALSIFSVVPHIKSKWNTESLEYAVKLAADKENNLNFRAFIIDLITYNHDINAFDIQSGRDVLKKLINDRSEDPKLRKYALLKVREPGVDFGLVKLFESNSEPVEVRAAALTAIGRTDSKQFKVLFNDVITSHRNYDQEILQHAIVRAAKNDILADGIDRIMEIVSVNHDQELYNSIIYSLGIIEEKKVVPLVISLYETATLNHLDPNPYLAQFVFSKNEKDVIELIQNGVDEKEIILGLKASIMGNLSAAIPAIEEIEKEKRSADLLKYAQEALTRIDSSYSNEYISEKWEAK